MTEPIPANTDTGRDNKGRFTVGNPGKPKGARHRLNQSALEHLAGLVSPSFVVLRDHLAQGNLKAAVFVLQRFLPEHRTIETNSTEPMAWADAMAAGDVTVAEAHKASGALKALIDASEVRELRERLDELEQAIAEAKRR